MRYWWVNQNQTFRHEFAGGYLWSPKRNANGARNPFYETMREVPPGDLILSFVDTRIAAIGIAASYCYESPKPREFGQTGAYWDTVGWRVRVSFQELQNAVRPKDHIDFIRPFLPERYSPLQTNGNGNQVVYLTELSPELYGALATLVGAEANQLREQAVHEPLRDRQVVAADMELWEHHLEEEVERNTSIDATERQASSWHGAAKVYFDKEFPRSSACVVSLGSTIPLISAPATPSPGEIVPVMTNGSTAKMAFC